MCMKVKTESASTITLGGIVYELTSEPSHGIVRAMRKMQKDLSFDLVKKHRAAFTAGVKVEDALNKIFEDDPREVAAFAEMNEEFLLIGTISVATNKLWTNDALDLCTDREVKEAFEKCKEFLGGDVTAFL